MGFIAAARLVVSAFAAAAAVPLLIDVPASAQTGSPCDSETAVPAGQDTLRADCAVLWDFYTHLDDPGRLDDTGPGQWSPNTPLSSWLGVAVSSASGRVVGLNLYNVGMAGTVSPRLGQLTGLTLLQLTGNKLTGPIPPQLGQLTNLTRLYTSNNQLTGPIPPQLGQLTNLTELALSENLLTGLIPPQLGQLTNLTGLYLSGNQLTGPIPSQLNQLTGLTELYLSRNHLTGSIPSQLDQLTDLDILNLSDNQLIGNIPSQLGQLTNLTSLYLYRNQLVGKIPSQLGQLANLIELALSENLLTGPIPPQLGQLTNLTKLDLSNNLLTGPIPPQLGQLTNLTYLGLIGNQLTGEFPPRLSRFDTFSSDPLRLISLVSKYRELSLGNVIWDVWLCETPDGASDLYPDATIELLDQRSSSYFRWLSNGRYQPKFRYAGRVKGTYPQGCYGAVEAKRMATPSVNQAAIITDADRGLAYGSPSSGVALLEQYLRGDGWSYVLPHEMGHAIGFPHSYGGLTYYLDEPDEVYPYDNPMDIMSSGGLIGTVAVNRYAAGWIDPANVAVHPKGQTHTYELRAPGAGGTQMLVLQDPRLGAMITLGARVAESFDSSIPKEGVEVYRVDHNDCAAADLSECWGLRLRIQPFPPAEPDADGVLRGDQTQHVHSVGDEFEAGTATVEIVERVGRNFTVRVTDEAEPDFAGRFSDDDASVHQANIEIIAGRGITVGCDSAHPDRFCPSRAVTRAQMMAFLARALDEEGNRDQATSRFTDVPDDAWYLPYLARLAELGVVQTSSGGAFRPADPLTRAEMAVLLTRAFAHITAVAEPTGVFEDVPADAPYAGEVEAILNAGITRGCSNQPMLYCPDNTVTRAQMASFLAQALESAP